MKHSYWGIACLLSALAGLGCMVYILAIANVWPADFAPMILMFFFFLLADMCAHRITDKGQKK